MRTRRLQTRVAAAAAVLATAVGTTAAGMLTFAPAADAAPVTATVMTPVVGFDTGALLAMQWDRILVNLPLLVRTNTSWPGRSDFTLNELCNCTITWINHTTGESGTAAPGPVAPGPVFTGSGDVSAVVDIPGGFTALQGAGNWWVP